jgi:cell division initiation protein
MSKNDEAVTLTLTDPAAPQARKLPGAERQLGVSPLDMRQAKFSIAMRGFERSEVASFLLEAAEGYEQSLRENERLRQEISRLEASLQQFRELEGGLRTMLVSAQRVSDDMRDSAQRVSDDMRENAQQEAARIVREAEGRAELLMQSAQAQAEDVQRDLDGLKMKRREAENALEATITSLQSTLAFVREQDARDLKIVSARSRFEGQSA